MRILTDHRAADTIIRMAFISRKAKGESMAEKLYRKLAAGTVVVLKRPHHGQRLAKVRDVLDGDPTREVSYGLVFPLSEPDDPMHRDRLGNLNCADFGRAAFSVPTRRRLAEAKRLGCKPWEVAEYRRRKREAA